MGLEDGFVVLENVSFHYGEQMVLNNISLSLSQGTSYALIGKSGVGKSTLLKLIAGFDRPAQGRVLIDNREIKSLRKSTAFLFQELGLFPWQTVAQAVAMPLQLTYGTKDTEIQGKVTALLQELGLEAMKDKYPRELSGGERQRTALARILIGKPDLLLMDEPTSALDSMTKEVIQQMILKHQQKLKAAMLFVTHDIEEAVLLGRKILLLKPDGTLSILDNSGYTAPDAKEQLSFYEKCIRIRKLLRWEEDENEVSAKSD